MPDRWTLRLRHTDPGQPRTVTPVQIHGLLTSLLEGPGADHTAAAKPFSASPLLPAGAPQAGSALDLRVGWLDDDHRPDLRTLLGEDVRLGGDRFTVTDVDRHHTPYGTLAATPPTRHADLRFVSPTFFSRNGRWLPLPDPVLAYAGLARRWNTHAPAVVRIPSDAERALLDAVALAAHDIATHPVDLGRGLRVGFTGTAAFTLLGPPAPARDAAFAALTGFAAHAGIGAHTTYGLGHVQPAGRPAGRPRAH